MRYLPALLLMTICWASQAVGQVTDWSTDSATDSATNTALESLLMSIEQGETRKLGSQRVITSQVLVPLYREAGNRRLWDDPDRAAQLLALLGDSWRHGMLPADFFLADLERRSRTPAALDARQRAELDVLRSEALIRYLYNRRFGKVRPDRLDRNINFRRELSAGVAPHRDILKLVQDGNMAAEVDRRAAHGPWYLAMQRELSRLAPVADAGGWGTVSDGPTLRPDDTGPRVIELRHRLAAQFGATPGLDNGSLTFDGPLEQAVRRFQQDHGLGADGLVGPATLRALNVPVTQRLDQLRLSLERLRWVSVDVEDKGDFLAVNIAGFRIYLVDDRQLRWTTRAMVGKPYRQTPIFTGRIQYLEFNPTWTVPPGIHRNDTLPAIKRDPDYLERSHMTVLTPAGEVVDPSTVDWQSYGRAAPFVFRQEPGPWNALGQVKFIFPNPHFVFLHDTNHRELFSQPSRAFSSGCIRVEDPLNLAALLLEGQDDWDRAKVDDVVAGARTQRVNLASRLPVYILYLTAAPDVDGSVLYLEDVYDRDARLLAALDAPLAFELPQQAALASP